MKQLTTIVTLLLVTLSITGQVVDKGWYYFKNPMNNIYGIGFNKPKADKDLSYVGSDVSVTNSDLVVLDGPDESYYVDNGWKKIILTSLFNNSNNLTLSVHSYKLKRVLLSGKRWPDFDKNNYYIIEGLRADSVFITGRITDKTTNDSKDLERIISAFAPQTTVAFKVIDAISNKDTTSKNNKGIFYRETGRNDTFSIIIKNPDVYFASKLVQLNSNPKDIWKAPLYAPTNNESIPLALDSRNEATLIENYFISNLHSSGVDLGLKFKYDEQNKNIIISLSKQEKGKAKTIIPIQTIKVENDNKITIDEEYPYNTNPTSTGYSSSEKYLTLLDYKLDFNPKTKEITLYGYQTVGGQTTYQTCIYQIRNKFKYWPKS